LLAITIVIILGAIAMIAAIFIGLHKTKSQHVKLKAGWKSVELEIDRPDESPPSRRQLDQPP
jgi:FtsZ-interacting cell division protein ZipA